MAKIKPIDLVKTMSGKVCIHSDTYFRTNAVTKKVTTGKLCNPYEGPYSTEQIQAKNRFAKVSAAVRTRIAALTSDEKEAMTKEWKADGKVGSFYGYCFKKWNSEYDENGDLIIPLG